MLVWAMTEEQMRRQVSRSPDSYFSQEAVENLRIYLRLLESQHLRLDSTSQAEVSRAQRASRLIDAVFRDSVECGGEGE